MLPKKKLANAPPGTTSGPKVSPVIAAQIVEAAIKNEKKYFPEEALIQLVKLHGAPVLTATLLE
jgi:hypothetical protein